MNSLKAVGASKVALLGALVGAISLLLPWLTLRANRLSAGESTYLSSALGIGAWLAPAGIWLFAALAGLGPRTRWKALVMGGSGSLALPVILVLAGAGASAALATADPMARASLGAGVWVGLLGAYILIHTARRELAGEPFLRELLTWLGPLLVVLAGAAGLFGDISLAREFTGNEQRFFQELVRHIRLSAGSVGLGACIAVPLGVLAAKNKRAERPVFIVSSTVETIPSLALFGLIIAPLSALSHAYPVLRELGIRGVGTAPALIALVLYSLLPIVHNTYVGLKQVSPAAVDAGAGMGMSPWQLARRVEFPLAAPLIVDGIRTASVQAVGNTAVAAWIGAGGLGHFIFQGLGQAAPDLILLGALPVIVLALLVDTVMRAVVVAATSRGMRREGTT